MRLCKMLAFTCIFSILLPTSELVNIFKSVKSVKGREKHIKYSKIINNVAHKIDKLTSLKSNPKFDKHIDSGSKNVSQYPKKFARLSEKAILPTHKLKVSQEDLEQRTDELILGINLFEMEIKVLVDSDFVEAIKNSNVELLDYLKIFFDTVNHIYEKSHPKDKAFPTFKTRVVSVEQLQQDIESYVFKPVSNDIVDIEIVLVNLRKIAQKNIFDSYDHTILLTGKDLYRKVDNEYQSDVLGVSYLNGTCTTAAEDGKYKAISIVEDIGARFLGVYPAVHEIAHNLGVKHDSKTTSSYSCHAKRGHIMSPVTVRTSNMFTFSECSLSSLKTFFFSDYGKCLAEGEKKPIKPDNTPPEFPGDKYSMEDICEHLASKNFENEVYYQSKVNPNKSPSFLCKQISCIVTVSGDKKFTLEPPFAPGEKMPCGQGGRCVSGECIQPKT